MGTTNANSKQKWLTGLAEALCQANIIANKNLMPDAQTGNTLCAWVVNRW